VTDTPLDLDAIRWRAERTAEMPMPGPRLTFVLNNDIPALLAEVETLRTQLAEARTENAEFVRELAKEAEGKTQYGVRWDRYEHKPIDWQEWPEAEARYYVSLQPAGVATLVRRFVGPVQAVEETTE